MMEWCNGGAHVTTQKINFINNNKVLKYFIYLKP